MVPLQRRILGQAWRVRPDLHVGMRDVGLLDNAGIDLVDLDVNEAGMTPSSKITDQGSQVGLERPAGQALRVRPGHGNLGGSHGYRELPQKRRLCSAGSDEMVVSVEDADVKAATIVVP